ncbi:MAG: carbohydrate-binding protein [Bacteroidales bacterium]|nr:carbohydrate-binding protein [Bacteroidales bacterium]
MDNWIGLSWEPAYDNYGVKEYEIFCNEKSLGKTVMHSFEVKDLQPKTLYNIKIVALDWDQNGSKALEGKFTTMEKPKNDVPGKIEAETFISKQGAILEQTSDTLGGFNLAWLDSGNWIEYEVNVKKTGEYTVSYRVATEQKDVKFELKDSKGTVFSSTLVNNTGGWQKWQTFTSEPIEMKAGKNAIKLHVTGGRVNLNWIEFK